MEEEIEEIVVNYETAKLAQEKKFDLTVRAYYNVPVNSNKEPWLEDQDDPDNYNDNIFQQPRFVDSEIGAEYTFTSAPTQALLQKWLREVHNIDFIIKPYYDSVNGKTYTADPISPPLGFSRISRQKSYEDALEIGLQEALKLINI